MNNKGVVLVIVMWVILILSLIAWGLSRRSSLEVSVMETYRGKLRSYAAARAGVNTILDLLQRSPSAKDTLYSTGIAIDTTKTPEEMFSHIDTGENAYAIVQWRAANFNTADAKPHLEYGLCDEGGKINLNALGANNYQILSALLQIYGLSQAAGDKLALSIVNYTGTNAQASGNSSFMSLSDSVLKPKNKPYQDILELLEVDGMTQDIFDKIKDDVTVFGDSQNGLSINVDTASDPVIQAVAYASARLNTSITATDIISKAYTIRDGADGVSFTSDDGVTSIATVNDATWPVVLQENPSNYYRARVVGVDGDSGARTVLEVVIHHAQGSPGEIISWQRD